MIPTNLYLRSLTSPYNDITRGTTLSHADLDNNFIYLKGLSILTATTNGSTAILEQYNGNQISFPMGSKILSKSVLFSDINGEDILMNKTNLLMEESDFIDILLPDLAANEYISQIFIESIEDFVGDTNDLRVTFYDITNNEDMYSNYSIYLQGMTKSVMEGITSSADYISEKPFVAHIKDIHIAKSICLRFYATDLTTLTEGSIVIYYKIETLILPL